MLKVQINFEKLNTIKRKQKALQIEKEMELIVNSKLWASKWEAILGFSGETSNYKHMSGKEVLKMINCADEILLPNTKGVINIDIDDVYLRRGIVGYTYATVLTVFTNTRFFDSEDLSPEYHHRKQSGSNLLHEWLHKIGFDHDFYSTERRPFSVCYQGNRIYEECWDELIAPLLKKEIVKYSYRRWFKTYTVEKIELWGTI